MKRGWRILGMVVALLAIGFIIFLNTGFKLPHNADEVINEVLAEDLPEMVKGETGFAKSGELDIWYEKLVPDDTIKGSVLLVMGHSSTAMLWPLEFCYTLVDAGYQVIRYDNRDVGMSSWVEDWDRNNPYTLEDMAKDGIAILDTENIEKAHVIGASMGGMIAQRMGISHSDRVLSLTSIMSSGYMMDPEIAPVSTAITMDFIRNGVKHLFIPSERMKMKFFLGVQQILKGADSYDVNPKDAARLMLYELRKRKGINTKAMFSHSAAIETSGSRYSELGSITAPTLAIHGRSDPLVNFAHAEKYVPLIPNCETLYIDEMGHDFPEPHIPEIVSRIVQNFGRAVL